ncbi:substrate-binding domain-containing protein [Pseudarthrobacter sp. Fe7]|nr:substrate-binding domain-containing protein [Pseudarthrobacter sp. Fe7]
MACRLNHDEIDGLLAIGKPAIGVGGPFPGLSTISIDDREVARQATEHLINLGHQHVAHIGGRDDHGPTFNMAQLRLDGYRQALRTNGLPLHPPWMTESDFTVAGGYRTAKRLLRDPTDRPTAIFSSSDEMAAGAMLAARELGLAIPDDLSIISIDGHELAQTFGITTYSQAPQEQGRRACLRLLSILKDPQLNPPFDEQFEAKLVTRSSTATPNARANHMEAAGTVR